MKYKLHIEKAFKELGRKPLDLHKVMNGLGFNVESSEQNGNDDFILIHAHPADGRTNLDVPDYLELISEEPVVLESELDYWKKRCELAEDLVLFYTIDKPNVSKTNTFKKWKESVLLNNDGKDIMKWLFKEDSL